jgi:RNA ligase-like protein
MNVAGTVIAEKRDTTYEKIETLFDRDPADMRHVIFGQFRDPAFALINTWMVTEKIHGTNVRVILEDGQVRIGGKTDDAAMPLFLLDAIKGLLPAETVVGAFAEGAYAVLYGEGYGPKIQKGGGSYRSDPSFRLFDVMVWGDDGRGGEKWWWLNWPSVVDIATKLAIETVPVLARSANLEEALSFVERPSTVALAENDPVGQHPQEGIVARTEPLLFTRRGRRLIWKLKARDLV